MTDDLPRSRTVASGWILYRDAPTDQLKKWTDDLPRTYDLEDYHVVDENTTNLAWADPVLGPFESPSIGDARSGTCFDIESTEMREACVDPIRELLEASAIWLRNMDSRFATASRRCTSMRSVRSSSPCVAASCSANTHA